MNSTIKHQTKKDSLQIKRTFYRWHIRFGLPILSVLMLWALAGLMRLFINHSSASANTHFEKSILLSEELPKWSLQEVMTQNGLRSLRNFHLVEMDGKRYYQLRDSYNRLQYFDADTGKPLPQGDQRYAEHLARYFADDQQSSVSIRVQKTFSQQYPESNRLLPVYKVSFHRPDAMDVYVETEQSRLSAFHSLTDKIFFWSFSEEIPPSLRLTLQVLLLITLVLFALSGWWVYGWKWKHYRHDIQPADGKALLHTYQRQIGLAVSFTVLAFACHGAFYSFKKHDTEDELRFVKNSIFKLEDLRFDTRQLPWESTQAHTASVINMPQGNFYQLFGKDVAGKEQTYYFNTENGEELAEGDLIYARYLANKFKAHKANIDAGVSFSCCLPPDTIPDGTQIKEAGIHTTTLITHFDQEYDFTHKRLPVVKVAYASPETDYFIETASSRLAVIRGKSDRAENRAFGSLHHFSFPQGLGGKRIRDILFLLSALGVLPVSILGMALYLKW